MSIFARKEETPACADPERVEQLRGKVLRTVAEDCAGLAERRDFREAYERASNAGLDQKFRMAYGALAYEDLMLRKPDESSFTLFGEHFEGAAVIAIECDGFGSEAGALLLDKFAEPIKRFGLEGDSRALEKLALIRRMSALMVQGYEEKEKVENTQIRFGLSDAEVTLAAADAIEIKMGDSTSLLLRNHVSYLMEEYDVGADLLQSAAEHACRAHLANGNPDAVKNITGKFHGPDCNLADILAVSAGFRKSMSQRDAELTEKLDQRRKPGLFPRIRRG